MSDEERLRHFEQSIGLSAFRWRDCMLVSEMPHDSELHAEVIGHDPCWDRVGVIANDLHEVLHRCNCLTLKLPGLPNGLKRRQMIHRSNQQLAELDGERFNGLLIHSFRQNSAGLPEPTGKWRRC